MNSHDDHARKIKALEAKLAKLGGQGARRKDGLSLQHQLNKNLILLAQERALEVERVNQLLKEKVDEVRSSKERMAVTIHDLKVPVTISLLNLELAGLESDPKEQEDYLTAVRRELEFLLDTIANMLDLEQQEAGDVHLTFQKLDLHEIVNSVLGRMQVIIKDKPRLTIANKLPARLPKIEGNRHKLIRVFSNLISNSIKYTESGSITVGRKPDRKGNTLTVFVKDTGQGIEPDRLSTLFDFFQGDSYRQDSSGVGLALVKQVLAAHHGNVWIESKRGKGTSVFLRLPVKGQSR